MSRPTEGLEGWDAERYHQILGSLPSAAYVCDGEGLIVYFNERARDLWGRAPLLLDPSDKFCGSHRLYDGKGTPLSHNASWMALALRHGRSCLGQDIIVERPDGTRTHVVAQVSPILRDAKVVGAINLLTELPSNAQLSEHAFAELFETVFELSTDGVLLTRSDGTILRANTAAKAVLSLDEEELRAKGGRGLFFDDQWQRALLPASEAGLTRVSIVHPRNGREPLHLEVTSIIVARTGSRSNALVWFRDVTQQLESERRLVTSQKMEAVGQLAGGIAHHFNNLLLAMEAACTQAAELSQSEAVRTELETVQSAIQNAAGLTSRLLSLGSKQVSKPAALDVSDAVAGTVSVLRRILRGDIRFEQIYEADSSPVFVDPSELEQVLLNLALNARDAMPQGGVLRFSTRTMEMTEHDASRLGLRPGRYGVVEVRDDGRGIAPEILPRVYEPFFTTKPVGQGYGLGLSTADSIARRSGGLLTCESELGRGSTFTLYLPHSAQSVSSQVVPASASSRGTEAILIVDDEVVVRQSLARYFVSRGYRVFEAGNGVGALAILHGPDAIDLLLSDVIMPEMGGVQLVETIWKERPALPVILMSGYGNRDEVAELVARGAHFLRKPFRLAELLSAVRQSLDTTYTSLSRYTH